MRKRTPLSHKVRNMLEQGYATKEIVAKLKVKPQMVYNMRYQINKAKGLGAIGTPAPVPTEGIGTPPKKPSRKVRAGTGFNDAHPTVGAKPGAWREITTDELFARPEPKPGEWVDRHLPITMIEPKPTLWQRVVRFFQGART